MKSAHVHLISVVAAELEELRNGGEGRRVFRILDVGCGYGRLMRDLIRVFPRLGLGEVSIEIHGYEVLEHRGSTPGYHEQVCKALARVDAEVDWAERVRVGKSNEPWPFADGFFDAVYSNQVIEHVQDLDTFFRQLRRVVKPGGFAAHFYPSKEILVEPHCGVLGAHWVAPLHLPTWLGWASRLGLGKYRRYRRERGLDLASYCSEFEVYLPRYVYLRGNGRVSRLARRWSAAAGFKYMAPLLKRALADDWELFPYRYVPRYGTRSCWSFLSCNTLLQRL